MSILYANGGTISVVEKSMGHKPAPFFNDSKREGRPSTEFLAFDL